jgi:hypothetical protein
MKDTRIALPQEQYDAGLQNAKDKNEWKSMFRPKGSANYGKLTEAGKTACNQSRVINKEAGDIKCDDGIIRYLDTVIKARPNQIIKKS